MWSGKETGKEEGKVSMKGNSTLVILKLCYLGHQQQQILRPWSRPPESEALSWGPAGLVHSSLLITTIDRSCYGEHVLGERTWGLERWCDG